jgi:hypothetical protein
VNGSLRVLGAGVLALVFVDELLALVALGVWGAQEPPRWLWSWLAPLVALTLWGLFASPKAPRGDPVARPLVKVVVLGGAAVALWAAGHPAAGSTFAVFSIAVNGAAQLPFARTLTGPQVAREA